jgi:hypothetical protein
MDRVREFLLAVMLGEDPVTNAEVLFDEIREQGYEGGRSILQEVMTPAPKGRSWSSIASA